jgi:hypothetical protein
MPDWPPGSASPGAAVLPRKAIVSLLVSNGMAVSEVSGRTFAGMGTCYLYFANSQWSPVVIRVALSDGFVPSAEAIPGYAVFISCELAQLATFAI